MIEYFLHFDFMGFVAMWLRGLPVAVAVALTVASVRLHLRVLRNAKRWPGDTGDFIAASIVAVLFWPFALGIYAVLRVLQLLHWVIGLVTEVVEDWL